MKVLVFGSNGLVGSSLKSTLPNESIFDEIKFSNRADTNLFSYEDTSKTILNFKPDIIINAAAKVGGIYANNTQRTNFLLENLKININILESSTKLNSVKIINLGSSCIYPLNAPDPIKESYFMSGKLEPTNSPYAMAKLTSIELGNAIKTEFGHDVINLMPTNLYGPNDNFSKEDSHVIPGLLRKMHDAKTGNEKTFSIWGTGKPLREFLYVDDLSRAIIYILKENINEELINIGSGEEISIHNLSLLIKEVVGFKGSLEFDSKMPDGNPRKFLDSSLINSYGWKPSITLQNGLKDTYKWFLKNSPRL
tara:strand:+ start:532 stop:1458 length:927 start_codon:yes stop_codon:yes gene_type:complete